MLVLEFVLELELELKLELELELELVLVLETTIRRTQSGNGVLKHACCFLVDSSGDVI